MRFVFIICWAWLAALLPLQARASDVPHPVQGYDITLVAQNLGKIAALAVVENDIFVLDAQKNRILRLRDQNQDGFIDIQTVYLLGFNEASHMVAQENYLYISDAGGIWKSQVGKNLAATKAPINIVPFEAQTHTPLAVSKAGLYAGVNTGNFTGVVTVNHTTHAVRSFAKSKLPIQALATSPSGQLWAVLQANNRAHVLKVNQQATLALNPEDENLAGRKVEDILLWRDHLLLATSRPKPEIIKYGFAYGELSGEPKPLIGGFSNPSIEVGKIDIWGSPTAMAMLGNGKLIFADGENGTIWQNYKTEVQLPNIKPVQLIETHKKIETPTEIKPPSTISGSSITSASSLRHGSMIGNDELLKKENVKPKK